MKDDKFTTSMLLAKDWLMEKWQLVLIAVAIVVVVIFAITYFSGLQESKKYTGADLINAATIKLRQQNYIEAIPELERIVSDYSGNVAARAQFYLANAFYESRNYDSAITHFEKYISSYSHDKIVTASAYAGIAACMESKQEFGQAADKYLEAIKYYSETPSAPDFYLGAVRCYSLGGDREKAESSLAQMEDKFPNTKYTRTASRLIMGVVN